MGNQQVKRATGWTCSLTLRSSRQRNLSRCDTNGATGVSDMAGKAARVCGRALREAAEIQCSELIAIFVTIVKRSKENLS